MLIRIWHMRFLHSFIVKDFQLITKPLEIDNNKF